MTNTAKDVERISHLRCLHERTSSARQRCRDTKAAGPFRAITDTRASVARELEAMARKLRDHADTLPMPTNQHVTVEISWHAPIGEGRDVVEGVADAWRVPIRRHDYTTPGLEILVADVGFGDHIQFHVQACVPVPVDLTGGLGPLR